MHGVEGGKELMMWEVILVMTFGQCDPFGSQRCSRRGQSYVPRSVMSTAAAPGWVTQDRKTRRGVPARVEHVQN